MFGRTSSLLNQGDNDPMEGGVVSRESHRSGLVVLLSLGLLHVLLHVFTNGNYGIFRDEFYYLDCANHLSWGYVDHPPFSIALLAGFKAVFGQSVHAIRLLPALGGGLLVVIAGLMAREFGGRRYAQVLAAVCVMTAPSYLGMTGFYSMNVFDLLFWAVSFYLLIRIIKTGNERLWLLLGLVLGLGLLNKLSILILGLSLIVALLATPHRKNFLTKHLWLGGGIALLIFLPHILWQIANDWPTLEFISNAKQYKIVDVSPLQFLAGQIFEFHPMSVPIWLVGLGSLLFANAWRRYRILGLIYIISFVLLMVQQSKVYYLMPTYVVLLAAGACSIESFFHRRHWSWPRSIPIGFLVITGLLIAPFAVPVLPIDSFVEYQLAFGTQTKSGERLEMELLPQHFADRFGWKEMVETVASVYDSLPAGQKTECAILTSNYGEAGAINYYGPRFGLPRAISQHNSYYLWGPGDISGNVLISIGISREVLENLFGVVTPAATIISKYAMPYESDLTVYICTGLKIPFDDAWRAGKFYI